MKHVCKEKIYCNCSTNSLEPNENCIVHSGGPWPPRCTTCGRFLKWETRAYLYEQYKNIKSNS